MRSRNYNTTRRGLAMMLVLLSVLMASILATSYLVSRDNSPAIGHNVSSSAAARQAAVSGLEMGIAILRNDEVWRTADPDGKILDDYSLAGATVDITITDLETALAPTSESEYVGLTVSASVDGVTQSATAFAYSPTVPAESVASVDLSEFAAFGRDAIKLVDEATLARWPMAPQSPLGRRVALGTRATGGGSIECRDTAAAIDATVYHGPGASPLLVTNDNGPPIKQVGLLDQIPMPDPPTPNTLPPDMSPDPDLDVNTPTTVNTDERYDDIRVSTPAGVLTLQGNIVVTVEDNLELTSGSRIVIDGDVQLVVFDDLYLTDAAIEVKPGATLTLFVGDEFLLNNGYVGDERPDDINDNTGTAPYTDLRRIRLYTIVTTSEPTRDWILNNNSVIKATVYAPTSDFDIKVDSALYGRVAAARVRLYYNGALFYDHALHERRGYTNPASAVFEGGGSIRPEVQGLALLDPINLQTVADATGAIILADGRTYDPPIPPPPPATFEVDYNIVSFGVDMSQWEEPWVTICHSPPAEPGPGTTITVPPGTLPAHLAHGDSVGSCE